MAKRNRTFVRKGKKMYKYYSGSPYWDYLFNKALKKDDSSNEMLEPQKGNPDISEEGSLNELYKDQQSIKERKETLKYILRTAIENSGLADQEKIVIQRIIYDGIPVGEVAKELKVSQPAISNAMKRAIKKISTKVKSLAYKYQI